MGEGKGEGAVRNGSGVVGANEANHERKSVMEAKRRAAEAPPVGRHLGHAMKSPGRAEPQKELLEVTQSVRGEVSPPVLFCAVFP